MPEGHLIMTLVERAAEMDSLMSALHRAAAGNGQVVVISGPPTSGRSELLRSFAHSARSQGALLLRAVAARGDGEPLGVVTQLLAGAETASPHLRRLMDNAVLTAMLHLHEPEGFDRFGAPVLRELSAELAGLAWRDPLVILVDDIQHADAASLNVLLYLARRAAGGRIMVVLTESAQASTVHARLRGELHRLPHCCRIRLGMLSREGVTALLAERLGPESAAASGDEAFLLTGGNPLLARAVVEDNLDGPGPGPAGLVVGDEFARAVLLCLYRTGPETLRVAHGLAVLGDDPPVGQLAQLLDVHAMLVSEALSALQAAGLLTGSVFRHPRARLAAAATLAPGELAALHARAAELLHQQGAPAVRIARHLVAADQPEAAWAAGVLREGGEHALAQGDVALALSCLGRAERSCPDERERALLTAMRAAVEFRIDPATAVGHLPALAQALRAGLISGRHAALVVELMLWSGRLDAARAALLRLDSASRVGRDGGAVAAAVLSRWLSYAFPGLDGLLGGAGAGGAAHRSVWVLAEPGLREVPALAGLAQGDTAAHAEQVLAQCEPDDLTIGPVMWSLAVLREADEVEKAAAWCDRFVQLVDGRRVPVRQALLTAERSVISLRLGDLRAAGEQVRRALTLLPAAGWGVAIGLPIAAMIEVTTRMGRLEEADAYLGVAMPPETSQTSFGWAYRQARGRYHLAVGRFEAALADFEAVGELLRRWGRDRPSVSPWRSEAAQALLALGRREDAEVLLKEQWELLGAGERRARGLTLQGIAATLEPAARLQPLREALSLFEATGDRLDAARVLADTGRAQYELGSAQQARVSARRARSLAVQCGGEATIDPLLPPLADAGAPEAGASAGSIRLLPGLSEAERRVAGLAALGHTNSQIAGKLFISVSAVEQHLTRVYRKLRVRRRTDLPWQLSSQG
jgi:DNA-binding CsgD family transcriptional regulator/tetratricopeptide (TPR) repeat protein